MYQVIYSSVVIWCAILSYFTMGRTLTTVQWIAIVGTSIGLAISAMGNTSPKGDCKYHPEMNQAKSHELVQHQY